MEESSREGDIVGQKPVLDSRYKNTAFPADLFVIVVYDLAVASPWCRQYWRHIDRSDMYVRV